MILEIEQEGKGEIEIFQSIPKELEGFLIASALPIAAYSPDFNILLQEFKGNGFSAWYSRYWMHAPVVLKARGDIPMLELRIAIKNIIRGKWDTIANPELLTHYFQMGFVPYVATRAIFEGVQEYQTFDIHFETSFLKELGIDYKTLDRFLNKVDKDQPAELSKYSYPCTPFMIDAVNNILHNTYSPAGKAYMLRNHITAILIAALEQVGKDELGKLPLSAADIEALHHVRKLIEENVPVYLSNDVLVAKAYPTLNAFKLSYGFKRVFGVNPYDYYLQLRFALGKQLLLQGHTVASVGNELEYDSPTTFIKEFKKRFGYTPKYFQKNGG
jgi:hypothetical protein